MSCCTIPEPWEDSSSVSVVHKKSIDSSLCWFCARLVPPKQGYLSVKHSHSLARLRKFAGEEWTQCAFCDMVLYAFNFMQRSVPSVEDSKTTFTVDAVQWVFEGQ